MRSKLNLYLPTGGGKKVTDGAEILYESENVAFLKASGLDGNCGVEKYFLNRSSLKALDLTEGDKFLTSLALAVKFRRTGTDSPKEMRAKGVLLKNLVDVSGYDVIRCYSPDCLTTLIKDFMDGEVSLEVIKKCICRRENIVYILIGERARKKLKKTAYIQAQPNFALFAANDLKLMKLYEKLKTETEGGTYIVDLTKEEK